MCFKFYKLHYIYNIRLLGKFVPVFNEFSGKKRYKLSEYFLLIFNNIFLFLQFSATIHFSV